MDSVPADYADRIPQWGAIAANVIGAFVAPNYTINITDGVNFDASASIDIFSKSKLAQLKCGIDSDSWACSVSYDIVKHGQGHFEAKIILKLP